MTTAMEKETMDGSLIQNEKGVFAGPTQVPVHQILHVWRTSAEANPVAEVLDAFPHLPLADAFAAISFGLKHPQRIAEMHAADDRAVDAVRPLVLPIGISVQ